MRIVFILSCLNILSNILQVCYVIKKRPIAHAILLPSLVIWICFMIFEKGCYLCLHASNFLFRMLYLIPWTILIVSWQIFDSRQDYFILGGFFMLSFVICCSYQYLHTSSQWQFFCSPKKYSTPICFRIHPINYFFTQDNHLSLCEKKGMQMAKFQEIQEWYDKDMAPLVHHVLQYENIFQIHTIFNVCDYLLLPNGEWIKIAERHKSKEDSNLYQYSLFVNIYPFISKQLLENSTLAEVLIQKTLDFI